MNKFKYIILGLLVFTSCLKDNDDDLLLDTLAAYVLNKPVEKGAVIACSASDVDTNNVLTFFYPKTGATNIRLYETETAQVDKNDFSNYKQITITSDPFFNGYLGKFTQTTAVEKWIIVTYELDDEIKISNPIRSKQITKPTAWNDNVSINQDEAGMPNFTWADNPLGDNAIYFEVVSDIQDNLLSGTYTYDNHFQYYNTSNVVLNITTQMPPLLIAGNNYHFTLMDVSEDNWVNWVVLKTFEAQ